MTPASPPRSLEVTAIIAAAGEGRRMGGSVPKQFMPLGGVSMLQRSVNVFVDSPRITHLIVVTRNEWIPEVSRSLDTRRKAVAIVPGGETRQESVAAAADFVLESADYVIVHDAARPFVSAALVDRTLDAAIESGAAIAALPSRETVKEAVVTGGRAVIRRTIPREQIYLAQTPQAFRRDVFAAAVEVGRRGIVATDEAALAELGGNEVRLVEGDPVNVKVTTESDLALVRGILGEAPVIRAGTGYDLHRLVEGRSLLLGGVMIPSEKGSLGHSDADVVCHAATDAILGGACAGDIGGHYPDTDPRWKGASSLELLRNAVEHVRQGGFMVDNIDVTVILERPKIRPHLEAIRASLAGALGIDVARVSVKAKTNEGQDAVGRGEAIAAHAIALLRAL